MEQFLKKVFIIFIMTMNLLAFIAGVFFTLKGIECGWLGWIPAVSYLLFLFSDILRG